MITNADLVKLQKLAKLNFSSEGLEDFKSKLDAVLCMIDQLHEADFSNVEPLRSVCEMQQRLVDDEVKSSDISADLLKNAPGESSLFAKEVKCFIVPKVVE